MVTTRGMTSPFTDEPGTVPIPNPRSVHKVEEQDPEPFFELENALWITPVLSQPRV
jgi:hypothetical protein